MVRDYLIEVEMSQEELDVSDSLELKKPIEIQVESVSGERSVLTPVITADFDLEKMMQFQVHLQKLEKNFKIIEIGVSNLEERTETDRSILR